MRLGVRDGDDEIRGHGAGDDASAALDAVGRGGGGVLSLRLERGGGAEGVVVVARLEAGRLQRLALVVVHVILGDARGRGGAVAAGRSELRRRPSLLGPHGIEVPGGETTLERAVEPRATLRVDGHLLVHGKGSRRGEIPNLLAIRAVLLLALEGGAHHHEILAVGIHRRGRGRRATPTPRRPSRARRSDGSDSARERRISSVPTSSEKIGNLGQTRPRRQLGRRDVAALVNRTASVI